MWRNRCAWVQLRLPLWAGGELVGADRRRVERHLVGCPHCRKRLDAIQQTLEVLQAAAAADPPVRADAISIWPSLARQIQESRRPYPVQPAWPLAWSRLMLGSTAALIGGAMLLLWWMRPVAAPVHLPAPLVENAPPPVTIAPVVEPPAPRAPAPRTRPRPSSARGKLASGGSGTSKEPPAPSNESGAEGDRTGSSSSDTRYTQ